MIAQLQQAYLEEAGELLGELEGALLEMETNPSDEELVGRVFRALHTIKGSSAMFGYEAIVSFTHEIETVYEPVRNGEVATPDLVDLTLQACDVIKEMLKDPPATGKECPAGAERIVAAFRRLSGNEHKVQLVESSVANAITAGETERTFFITIRPDRQIFRRGINPIQLLKELGDMGTCHAELITDEIPSLAELDPEACFLGWNITITTTHSIDAVQDVFMFLGDDSCIDVKVAKPGSSGVKPTDTANHEPASHVLGESDHAGHGNALRAISSIRVGAEKLDQLVNLVGEMVTAQARLSQTAAARDDAALIALAEEIERLTTGLRDTALNIRMLPIGGTFGRLRRLVHDLSHELGKDVELITEGSETELDKTVIERLTDPLIHLIRNSIDHGIEEPAIRVAAGKPHVGTIRLTATHSGDSVILTFIDDGAGIRRDSLRARAVEKGLLTVGSEISERDLLALIFTPGFSTSEKVTNISGRGVGMDVVKRGVDALRGSIGITSTEGEGTTVTIRIPLTLAIIESLLVQIGADHFVLPLSVVEECIELSSLDVSRAHGRQLVNVRGSIVPYVSLRERFCICGPRPDIEQVVITEINGRRIGFVVDHVIGGHQTVIKSIGRMFREVEGISGATILGDGTVALILDVQQLVAEDGSAGPWQDIKHSNLTLKGDQIYA